MHIFGSQGRLSAGFLLMMPLAMLAFWNLLYLIETAYLHLSPFLLLGLFLAAFFNAHVGAIEGTFQLLGSFPCCALPLLQVVCVLALSYPLCFPLALQFSKALGVFADSVF
jgi:hypothetical protein